MSKQVYVLSKDIEAFRKKVDEEFNNLSKDAQIALVWLGSDTEPISMNDIPPWRRMGLQELKKRGFIDIQ